MQEKINVNYVLRNRISDTGISRYANSLISNISQQVNMAKIIPKFIFNYPYSIKPQFKNGIVHFTEQSLSSPLIFKKYKKSIVTVHDLIPLKFNLFQQLKNRPLKRIDKLWYNLTLKNLKKAQKFITVSKNTKKNLIEELNISEEKIEVVYEGVDKSFKPIKTKKNQMRILYVGNEFPHKNFKLLLEAVALIKEKLPCIELVKIGNPLWPGAREENIKLIKKLELGKNIIFKNYVEDLVEEYNQASVFVFPSLYEGFGLPILEAMACGCPTLSANNTSIPEVVGNAGLLFNSEDKFELEKQMYNILTKNNLRKRLAKQGLQRAKLFTWKKCAEKTLRVYKEVV